MSLFGRKTIKAGPFRATISKSGVSGSVGGRSGRVGINSKGRKRASIKLGKVFRLMK